MAGILIRFSFAAVTGQFGCRFGKRGDQRRQFPRKSKITSRPSLTLNSSDSTLKLKTNMVKPRRRRFHFIENDSDTERTIP